MSCLILSVPVELEYWVRAEGCRHACSCVCGCVCEGEQARDCVCVLVRARARERERHQESVGGGEKGVEREESKLTASLIEHD